MGVPKVTKASPQSVVKRELLKKMEKEDATLDTRHEVKYVGAHICQGMRNNSVISSSNLVAAALLDFPAGEWISEAEICVHIDQIRGNSMDRFFFDFISIFFQKEVGGIRRS